MTQILSSRMIGREVQLEQLRPRMEGVAQGQGGFALITGEAGIEKTRFVAAVLDSLGAVGVTCVSGGCLKELQLLPYAPAAEALRAALGNRGAPQHVDPYLLHLLSELDPAQAPIAGESVESGAVRYRLAQAVCGVLEYRARLQGGHRSLPRRHRTGRPDGTPVHRMALPGQPVQCAQV